MFISQCGAIRKISPIGTNWVVATLIGPTTFGNLAGPSAVAVDTNGCLYVADQHNGLVRKIIPDGTNWIMAALAGFFSEPRVINGTGITNIFNTPHGIALDQYGNMFVVDMDAGLIRKGWPADSPTACVLNTPTSMQGRYNWT